MQTIVALQPRCYLADTYLEQSLMAGTASHPRALMVLDSAESNYLNHLTAGMWPARVGLVMPSVDDGPVWHSCLAVEGDGVRALSYADDSFDVSSLAGPASVAERLATLGAEVSSHQGLCVLLHDVASLPLQAIVRGDRDEVSLTVAPVRTDVRQLFSRAPYKQQLLELLRGCGCDEGRLETLGRASFAYGFPFSTTDGHCGQSVVSVDLGYLTFQWSDGDLVDIRAGILVTDRSVTLDAMLLKPMIVYQWHITDNCDQLCRHCYLFAEDAQARCMSTPWDKLLHTLDEIEDVAARRHLVPMLAVSGGDPSFIRASGTSRTSCGVGAFAGRRWATPSIWTRACVVD